MANYTTTLDLKKGVLHRAGELTDGTSEYEAKVIEYLNRAYQATLSGAAELGLNLGDPWPWAQNKYPKVLNLVPEISSVTATTTQDSTAITFGAAPPNNLQDWYIKFEDKPEVYRIASHSGVSTSATLDGAYVSPSATNINTKIFKLEYELDSGILRLVSPMITYQSQDYTYYDGGKILMMDESQFKADYPVGSMESGSPDFFSQVYKDENMQVRIRFNRIPNQQARVEYNYIPVPAPLTNEGVVEVQSITPSAAPTGGAYFLNFAGDITASIAFGATAATIQTAIRTLDGLGAATVTGTLATALTITFNGYYGDAPLITVSSNTLVNGITPVTLTVAEVVQGEESIPIVPRDHRICLEYYATYYLMLDKQDSRAAEFRELTRASLLALSKASNQEKILTNPNFANMIPRPDMMPNRRRWWGWWY